MLQKLAKYGPPGVAKIRESAPFIDRREGKILFLNGLKYFDYFEQRIPQF
jgi:hypothetical protein